MGPAYGALQSSKKKALMPGRLVSIDVPSIYKVAGQWLALPRPMAWCTPDTRRALAGIRKEVERRGGRLLLSDLFHDRTAESGRPSSFGACTGDGMHEAGRAFDVDLGALRLPLAEFWALARGFGVVPIHRTPDPALSEAWHFECRGSHQRVYDQHASKPAGLFRTPYLAMAASATLAAGLPHDLFIHNADEARLQSGLIRLGHDIGGIDGLIGFRSMRALRALALDGLSLEAQLSGVEWWLRGMYPAEYGDAESMETALAA